MNVASLGNGGEAEEGLAYPPLNELSLSAWKHSRGWSEIDNRYPMNMKEKQDEAFSETFLFKIFLKLNHVSVILVKREPELDLNALLDLTAGRELVSSSKST